MLALLFFHNLPLDICYFCLAYPVIILHLFPSVIDVSQRMLERLEKLMKEECDDESFTINGKVFHADQVKQKVRQ